MFKYREWTWYSFGVMTALRNLRYNGTRLGLKKSFGKLTQPINSYTRFPEYHLFAVEIEAFLATYRGAARPLILDIGSPKLFGLYLAYHYDVIVHLTDITRLNIDEYETVWRGLQPQAKGTVVFDQLDGRALAFPDKSFDVVYFMSVLEHIEGEQQDTQALTEALRVLKPGGRLLLSVPFGPTYIEQSILGVAHAVEVTNDARAYFFQRIYDQASAERRLIEPVAAQAEHVATQTIFRRPGPFTTAYHRARRRMGENLNGLLGFANPLLSLAINRTLPGVQPNIVTSYSPLHSRQDIYGDLFLAGQIAGDPASA
jgi:SAM-dependent methyltransferase